MVFRAYSCLHLGVTPVTLSGPDGVLGVQPKRAACKASNPTCCVIRRLNVQSDICSLCLHSSFLPDYIIKMLDGLIVYFSQDHVLEP